MNLNATNTGRRIVSGMVWGQVAKASEVFLTFAFSVLVIRKLTPDAYGLYSLLTTVVWVGMLLSSFGFAEMLGRNIPTFFARDMFGEARFLLRKLIGRRLVFSLILGFLLYLVREPVANLFGMPGLAQYMVFAMGIFALTSLTELLAAFYGSLLKFKAVALIKTITQLFSIGVAIVLFLMVGPHLNVVLISLLVSLVVGLLAWLMLARNYLFGETSPIQVMRPLYSFGFTIWMTGLVTFGLTNQVDILIIGYLLKDSAQIAYYSVAIMIVTRIYILLVQGWQSVLLPSLSEIQVRHDNDGMIRLWTTYLKFMALTAVPPFIFLGWYADVFVTTFFRDTYVASIFPLRVYVLFTVVALFLAPGLAMNVLYVQGKQRQVLFIRAVTGVLNVLLAIFLISQIGILGAILATGFSSVIITALLDFIFMVKKISFKYPFFFAGKVLICAVGSLVLLAWWKVDNLIGLVGAGALYVLLYIVLLRLVKPLEESERDMLGRVDSRLGRIAAHFST